MNKVAALKTPVNLVRRCISTSSVVANKKNFRKFYIPPEVRGDRVFREKQKSNKPDERIPLETYGARATTILDDYGNKVEVAEMIPELIVPDLKDFPLKPYVSYRTADFQQSEFTAEDLFNAVYSNKIVEDWNKKQLNEDGTPKTPSEDELLEAEEAFVRARKTGSDIFGEKPRFRDDFYNSTYKESV
ncbi:39S ribosomal protein L41, mitochondrial [Sitodiplosis mosellana]|uniref:39S ribosomal protein L41, mitochondrial n=1 Tax=Sitodiplosis mosellana TaxID=263140 RepID=UPI002445383D|nr:39S ribosomal protein L41, mitochondrial [Sitodiplosis mosellana]